MKRVRIKCDYCGKEHEKYIGHVNRARSIGANLYCDHKCAGMARRQYLPTELKKQEKSEYDKAYRDKNEKKLKKKREAWFKKDYADNPEKYRKIRKKKQKQHNEYCSQPAYRKKKKDYDRKRMAKKHYGKYWEAAIALRELGDIVDNRRAKQEQKSINKSQNRKRYANKDTKRKELESCTMGLYQQR